jgi:NTE family protein
VLDRLLQDDTLEIGGVSGTSAGAMNAVALAAGLMEGGREGARESLGRFWRRVAQTSPFHALEMGPLASLWGPDNPWLAAWTAPWQQAASLLGSQFSPYQLNPLNLNPLRDVLIETGRLRSRLRLQQDAAVHRGHPGAHRRPAHLPPA